MARNKIGLQVKELDYYMAKLDELGNGKAMKRGVEAALKASKQHVNPLIETAMAKSNLPAGGKYSTGRTKDSIDKDMIVEWQGMTASIKIGFDFKKSGLVSILLMHGVNGTPRIAPVAGLKNAIYGTKTQKEIAAIQEEELQKVILRIMEG